MGITDHSSNPFEEPTLRLQSIFSEEFWSISVANQHLPEGGTKDRQVQPWQLRGTAGEGKPRPGWEQDNRRVFIGGGEKREQVFIRKKSNLANHLKEQEYKQNRLKNLR